MWWIDGTHTHPSSAPAPLLIAPLRDHCRRSSLEWSASRKVGRARALRNQLYALFYHYSV